MTAFVLRYRVRHTPEDDEELRRITADLDVRTRSTPWLAGRHAIIGKQADHAATLGMADGRQAVRYVRDHALRWGIYVRRIGMVGFPPNATDVWVELYETWLRGLGLLSTS